MLKTADHVPAFADEAEERAWWEAHGTDGLVDWGQAVRARFPNLKPSPQPT